MARIKSHQIGLTLNDQDIQQFNKQSDSLPSEQLLRRDNQPNSENIHVALFDNNSVNSGATEAAAGIAKKSAAMATDSQTNSNTSDEENLSSFANSRTIIRP